MSERSHGTEGHTSDIHERLLPRGVGHGLQNLSLVPRRSDMFQGSLALFDGVGFWRGGGVDKLWRLMEVSLSQWLGRTHFLPMVRRQREVVAGQCLASPWVNSYRATCPGRGTSCG